MSSLSDDVARHSVRIRRDGNSLVIDVEDHITDLLGWLPEQLVGRPSTRLIHPADQAGAVNAWQAMVAGLTTNKPWRGRYQSFDGTWTWVETINENHLDDPDFPCVITTMTRVAGEQVGIEESLRAREQLLSRLSDALPVGVFQIDSRYEVTFTNDRLHAILGVPESATTGGLFISVPDEDRLLLEVALARALADEYVDDVELTVRPTTDRSPGVVCLLSLRPLSDPTGHVTGAVGCLSDVTEHVRMRRQLEHRATVDELTSCLNRSATLDALGEALAQRGPAGTAVIFFDLDHFKAVNDAHGHVAGDRVLQEAARRLRCSVRPGDRVGRLGGDEFLVVCGEVTDEEHAFAMATRLAGAVAGDVVVGGHTVTLRASVGVAWADGPVDADALVARADRAMYENKSLRRDAATLACP